MSKFYKPGKELTKLLTSLDFKHCPTVPNIKIHYFVNKTGHHIKIDNESSMITLLNKKGALIAYSSTFTEKEIMNFINIEL